MRTIARAVSGASVRRLLRLLTQLQGLTHKNGKPLIEIYGPQTGAKRGGTIAMNFFDNKGILYDFIEIEKQAFDKNISLRTGCFCNPGIDETNHQLEKSKLKSYFQQSGEKDYFDLINFMGQKRGAVRVSIGYITNFKDVENLLLFCKNMLDKTI